MKTETESADEVLGERSSLSGWVAGGISEIQTNEPDSGEYKPGATWDLRPKGPQGKLEGAGARQEARLRHLENLGAAACAEEAFEGSGTVISLRQGKVFEENVIACEPIPMTEIVPNDPNASGIVTPLWRVKG